MKLKMLDELQKVSNPYLEKCVYFEIHDDSLNAMNYYMFISWRWIRGDDGAVFLPSAMSSFIDAICAIKDRKITLKFYGRHINTVVLNG